MTRVGSLFLTTLGAVVLAATTLHAQGGRSDDNVLYPQPPLPLFIGPEFGYAVWDIDASFVVTDGDRACAVFADGEGAGPTVGMRAFAYVTPWIFISPRLRYEARQATFLTSLDPEPVRDERDSIVMLTREGQVDATISTFTLDARVGIDLFETGFYIAAGPTASLVASHFYDYTERITGPAGFVHSDNGDNESLLVASRAFDNSLSYVVDARAAVGILFDLGPFVLNPEASYTYPLTSFLAPPDTMTHRGFSGSVGILFNFGESR